MKQKVVVIGHGTTTRLGIVRAVAALQCEITVIVMAPKRRFGKGYDTTRPFDCYSRYISHIYYCPLHDTDEMLRLIRTRCADSNQKVILLPDSDMSAAVIDQHQQELSVHFLMPHIRNTPGAVAHWMDKSVQKALAAEVGLNVAGSTVVELHEGKFSIPRGIRYPVFTKALASVNGGKQCFRRCDNEEELRAILLEMSGKCDMRVLVEDFLDIETEYAVLGFSDGEQVIIPGVIRFVQNSASHFGIAAQGRILPINGFETLLEQFKEFVRRVGFVGVFDIDFFYCSGRYYFGELNLRFGGSGYAVTKMGVNLPAMLVRCLTGQSIDDMQRQVIGEAVYVNERMCFDDWYRGFIPTSEYRRLLSTADISFIHDDEDPMPHRVFNWRFRIMYLRRILKRMLGRK